MTGISTLETVRFSGFDCPKCSQRLFVEASGPVKCPDCHWSGEAHILRALRERAETAQDALPDKAACAYHPSKQAVAICAGTGSYICSLCAVEMDGKIYGADYLNRAGSETLEKSYARTLDRPDVAVSWALLVTLMPLMGVVAIPFVFRYYFRAIRARRADPLMGRLYSRFAIVAHGLAALIMTAWQGLYILVLIK